MMIKFLAHGAGSARRAADYLLGTHDHNGEERAEVRPLLGDMHRVATVADSLPFKWRYSSAVVAWTRKDDPSDWDLKAVLADFGQMAFAGMEPDEYSWSAVLHVDQDGSKHIHILIARVDLATGRSYNPAPPGWQKSFDLLRDMYNYERGWARPDDPARRRPVQLTRAEMHDLLERGREKEMITTLLMDRVLAGAGTDRIRDRAGVVAALEEMPVITEITRVSKNFISVRVQGHEKPLRLKGPIYGEDFDAAMADELILDAKAARHGLREPDSEPDPEMAESAREAMEAAIQKRAEQFQKSHRRVKPDPVPAAAAEAPAPMPVLTKKLKKPEVKDDGSRTLIARLAEAVGSAIHRAREAVGRAFERFDGALGRYDRAFERFDGALGDHDRGLRELAAAGESIRRAADATHRSLQRSNVVFEQGLRRLRERAAAKPAAEDNDLDDVLNPKQKSGTSGPRRGM